MLEEEIKGEDGNSVWVFWFDMDCDWTKEYVNKMYKKSKIDQVLEFYGIPHIYKWEWKKYLKYRIKPEHYKYVNSYFIPLLRSEWYDVSEWDYWLEQEEYNKRVPVAEQTWLNIAINYDNFLENDRKHREAIEKKSDPISNQQILEMQSMMKSMMEEMKELKKIAWSPQTFLNSNNTNNEWNSDGWSDSTTNATNNEEVTFQEDGKDWEIDEVISGSDCNGWWDWWIEWSNTGIEWS